MSLEVRVPGVQSERLRRRPRLLYHHARGIEHSRPEEVYPFIAPMPQPSEYYSYREALRLQWLLDQVGFVPIFLAVGMFEEARKLTGFPLQNKAVFSFGDLDGIFTDYKAWEDILFGKNKEPKTWHQAIFRPELTKRDWIRKSLAEPNSVQLLVPSLDLSKSLRVTASYPYQKWELIDVGFNRRIIRLDRTR